MEKQLPITHYLIVLTLHKILGDCVCQW
jgi:hypothetical protein